jgi:hypothetical protein
LPDGGVTSGGRGVADGGCRRATDILPASAYGETRAESPTTRDTLVKTALIAVPLLAILVGAGWFAIGAWFTISGPSVPASGYIAMAAGVAFSLVVGCGLMALVFYSNRHGYDEPYRLDEDETGGP